MDPLTRKDRNKTRKTLVWFLRFDVAAPPSGISLWLQQTHKQVKSPDGFQLPGLGPGLGFGASSKPNITELGFHFL